MLHRLRKRIRNFITAVCLSVVLIMGITIARDGMYLLGVPEIDRVERVTISYPGVTVKKLSDPEEIELAVKLTGFLRFTPFKKADTGNRSLIIITYYTSDGEEISVAANRETVWWHGKARAIRRPDMFINLTESIFFMAELREQP